MPSREFDRDNLAGVSIDSPWKVVLIPGMLMQWFMYMRPSRGFHGLAVSSRAARSPAMTYIFSVVFWVVLVLVGVALIQNPHG